MPRKKLQNNLFYCNHLGAGENDLKDIKDFTAHNPYGEGLVTYLQHFAIQEELVGQMRTYLVHDRFSSELAGYFSLKAGLISLDERHTTEDSTEFDTMPGIELANFAVNQNYLVRHKELSGIGCIIFQSFILPLVQEAASIVGVRIIYIFALPVPELILHYNREYGFVRLDSDSEDNLHQRVKPAYDKDCIFMFQPIY